MQAQDMTLSDYGGILRRRWRPALLVGLLVAYAAVFLAYHLPAIYESSATILIEQQEVPTELIRTTITGYADERLQNIRQRVMAAPRVEEIIQKHDLYLDERETASMQELVSLFRSNSTMSPLNITALHERTGRETNVTYAFQVSFQYPDAVKARDIVEELSTVWLAENEAMRVEQARRTRSFLDDEVARIEARISETSARLEEFKDRYADSLPEAAILNMQDQNRFERELTEVNDRLRVATERKALLQGELAETPRFRPVMNESGEPILGGTDRLAQLQQELIQARSRYSDNHPDVIRLRREIASMSDDATNQASMAQQLRVSLAASRRNLEVALESLSPDHPDVIRLQRAVSTLEQQLAELERTTAGASAGPAAPNNPPYLELQTRIRTADSEIQELSRRRADLTKRLDDISRRSAQSPRVEREYAVLTREYDLLTNDYRELRAKQTEAGLAETLEADPSGERLRVIEPPLIPSDPIKPNRAAFSFLGILLAIALGLGVVSLAESMDSTVRGQRDVNSLLEMPPLAIIPYIETRRDRGKRIFANLAMAMVAVVAVGSLYQKITGI
jgi:polysaccharide biosynthesis transport protein